MLRKLLKYEFMSSGRLMGLIYAAVILVSILCGVFGRTSIQMVANDSEFTGNFWPFILTLIIYVVLAIALMIITLILVIRRFYDNMLGGEGYLTHTLPVATWQHMLAKTISGFVWEVLAMVVLMISVLCICGCSGLIHEMTTVEGMNYGAILAELGLGSGTTILFVVTFLVQLIRVTLMFYAAMAIGQTMSNHKMLYSVLFFIVICIVISIISTILALIPVFGMTGSNMMNNLFNITLNTLSMSDEIVLNGQAVNSVFGFQILEDFILSAVLFIISTEFLKKKLNLQ